MRKKLLIMGILLLAGLITLTSCRPKEKDKDVSAEEETQQESVEETEEAESQTEVETETEEDAQEPDVETIMAGFNELFSGEAPELKDVAEFIKKNAELAGAENVSEMIVRFEALQKEKLAQMEEKFYSGTVQQYFQQSGFGTDELNSPELIQNEEIRALTVMARESGYRTEMAEGSYFPIIDYSFYRQFSSYASPDIKDYIEIMAAESEKRFARDAALTIGWDEVVERALSQEAYLINYPGSAKAEDIRVLYDRYKYITFHGLDNTPLFDYGSRIMSEEAKSAYSEILSGGRESEYVKKIREFMDIAATGGYKLTTEVKNFIQNN